MRPLDVYVWQGRLRSFPREFPKGINTPGRHMCRVMRKHARTMVQIRATGLRLCFRYTDSATLYFLNPKFQVSSHLLWRYVTVRFVSDLVGNPEDRFSREMPLIIRDSYQPLPRYRDSTWWPHRGT